MSAFDRPTHRLGLLAAGSGSVAAVLWGKVLADAWPLLFIQGPICGRSVGLLGHCALCFPAAVLTGVALGAASRAVMLRRRALALTGRPGS